MEPIPPASKSWSSSLLLLDNCGKTISETKTEERVTKQLLLANPWGNCIRNLYRGTGVRGGTGNAVYGTYTGEQDEEQGMLSGICPIICPPLRMLISPKRTVGGGEGRAGQAILYTVCREWGVMTH